jgi:hypothetical protein
MIAPTASRKMLAPIPTVIVLLRTGSDESIPAVNDG